MITTSPRHRRVRRVVSLLTTAGLVATAAVALAAVVLAFRWRGLVGVLWRSGQLAPTTRG